jgi:hypothetical protein
MSFGGERECSLFRDTTILLFEGGERGGGGNRSVDGDYRHRCWSSPPPPPPPNRDASFSRDGRRPNIAQTKRWRADIHQSGTKVLSSNSMPSPDRYRFDFSVIDAKSQKVRQMVFFPSRQLTWCELSCRHSFGASILE